MAAASCSTVALFKNLRRNPVAISSSSSKSVSSSFGRRRNHLRPKILKTLIKPYPTPSTPIPTPPAPLLPPTPLELVEIPDSVGEEVGSRDVKVRVDEAVVMKEDGGGSESDRVECDVDVMRSEIRSSEIVVVDRFAGKLDMKIVGVYGLGLFVLQAVCAVLIFGSARVSRDGEDEEFEIGGSEKQRVVLEDDVRIRRIVAKASRVVNVDEAVLEERIGEIRAMARNAREREAKEGRGKSDVEGLGEDGIEKEVSTRLVRLQKKLGSVHDKPPPPVSLVNSLSKMQEGSGSSEDIDGKLVFLKKQTFRNSIPTKPMNDAKGFSNVIDQRGNLVDKQEADIDPSNLTNLTSPSVAVGNSSVNDLSTSQENVDKKLLRKKALELKRRIANKKTEATVVESNAGDVQDINVGKPVGTSNTSTIMGASLQEVVKCDKNNDLSSNGSSENGDRKTALDRTLRDEGSGNKADSWWLHLPYVFAILMRQGSGPGGLYTLKATVRTPEKQDEAYTVVFADRGDANNFCYIVESFFEDVADFTADILPLPTKEMREPVESGVLNMIFVKKGQLELYAGQPLGEVETRLRSLVI